jgi:UDP-glucose 4-epimerase
MFTLLHFIGIRDYVHVMDIATAHVTALSKLKESQVLGCKAYNLGKGQGLSVLGLVSTFQAVSGVEISYTFAQRRPGDVARTCADSSLAEADFGWRAEKSYKDMCKYSTTTIS